MPLNAEPAQQSAASNTNGVSSFSLSFLCRFRHWSDNTSWTNGLPPSDCSDDVVILPQWRMLLDVDYVCVGQLFIHGELVFEDKQDYILTAKLVRNIFHTL